MAWRAARSLTTLHAQLQRGAPRAAPPATPADAWGLIGDAAHDPTSDHSPHDFPGWGSQIVTAGDFPNVPALGLDARQVLDDIRRSHDGRVKYGISNGQMFSSYATSVYPAWTWRPYSGKDGHFGHGHLSVVGDPRADGTQPWATIGGGASSAAQEEDDMGQSFGPTPIERSGATSLCIPPVQGGLADPRKVWLNVGGDTGNDKAVLRVWGSDGAGNWAAVEVDPAHPVNGLYTLKNGVVLSVELRKGLRLLSVTRMADADGKIFGGSLSACFERE